MSRLKKAEYIFFQSSFLIPEITKEVNVEKKLSNGKVKNHTKSFKTKRNKKEALDYLLGLSDSEFLQVWKLHQTSRQQKLVLQKSVAKTYSKTMAKIQ